MIETYYDIITKLENFVDGLMIVDKDGFIKYNKKFSAEGFPLDEEYSIGKTPMDIFPNLNKENSTCYKALKYGETTENKIQKLKHISGEELMVIDNTFPIIENSEIIGAVSTSKFIEKPYRKSNIDLSNIKNKNKDELYDINDIIGSSKKIELLKYRIHKISNTNSNVLIYGETGTGKEMIAQSIHANSVRKDEIFISQNCAAIPHSLLESIFFGTTKGSYTDAEDRPGIFELAHGGTIFLDEINSMDMNMQSKLLTAIEQKRITKIGGLKSKKVNVRIIAAINENPRTSMENGYLRPDLFYRLSSLQIKAPALRERKEDLEELISYFINCYNKEMNKNIRKISKDVLSIFLNYNWSGNVRELRNIIEGAFVFSSSDIITIEDIPDYIINHKNNICDLDYEDDLNKALEKFEVNYILSHSKKANSSLNWQILLIFQNKL